jgi:5-methylcytosine-specific restriction endonuclease McrA
MPEQSHVVIRQESYVAGTRERPEVGIFTQTHTSRPPVPWGKIGAGDLVWMKWSGGPILRQSTHGQAEVLSLIVGARHTNDATLVGAQRRQVAWERLVHRVQRVVHEQPLWKLQTVGAQPLEFLYPNAMGSRTITLRTGVSYCLRSFHGLISELVRAAWLRHVRRVNGDVLGSTIDLTGFLFGTERTSLSVYQPFLSDLQRGRCFYCQRSLGTGGEVDHFIPWARYPVDLGHNFVLAHGNCNQSKSSHLGAVPYLERWVERNDLHAAALVRWFASAGVEHDLAASQHVAGWAYAQTARANGQVWAHGRTLVPLDPRWTSLLPGGVT